MTEIIKRWVLFTDAQGTTDLADLDFFVRDKAVDELKQFILASDHDAALAAERELRVKAEKHRDAAYTEAWRTMDDSETSHRERTRNDIRLVAENDSMLEQLDQLKTERDQLRARVAELEAEIYDANKGDRS